MVKLLEKSDRRKADEPRGPMLHPSLTPCLRALRDAGWVLLVLGVLTVAFLLVTGYGEGAV